MTTTPRRPLVPGPTNQSIAARAIAVREQARVPSPATNGGPPQTRAAALPAAAVERSAIGQITAAVAKVMSEVGTIQKTGFNKFHGYHYASMADVFHAVTPLMGRHGIMYTQSEIEVKPIENNRLAVLYEFVFSHSSGESLPPMRFTSLVMARDSKGNYDDKALNKAHSNARKYVVVGLFNIPAGDFDEADSDENTNANRRQEKAPVPGPSTPPPKEITPEAKARASEQATEDGVPHRIVLGQGSGPDKWAMAFIRAIDKCASVDEIGEWDKANEPILQSLSDNYPGTYDMVSVAVTRRSEELEAAPRVAEPENPMPDPKAEPVEALNWVADQLQQLQSAEAINAFWSQYVEPRKGEFDQLDWDMLMQEHERAQIRANPPDDEPEPPSQGIA